MDLKQVILSDASIEAKVSAIAILLDKEFPKLTEQVETVKKLKGEQGERGLKGDKGDKGDAGKDGKDGRDGINGTIGKDGKNGKDGISIVDARIDFDNHLILVLSNKKEIDAGAITTEKGFEVYSTLKQTIDGNTGNGTGTVTSVGMSVPTGLQVSGTPITTTGTFDVTFQSGYSIPTVSNQTNWNTAYGWGNHASAGYESASNKGIANGYAGLDASGFVPSAQLPSYVDDVLEYANLASFPATGTTGKIYVALDTNKVYRWSGSAYIEISPSPGSTDSVTEGSTNLYFTNARARSAISVNGSLSYNSSTGVISYTQPTNVSTFTNDSGYLTSSAIGVSVQAYDVDLTSWAAITPSSKQDALVSGTNIKTVNGSTLLGSGDLTVSAALAKSTSVFTSGSTQTYTAPANTSWVKVTVVGPGGNGGAANNQRATGGGGGAVAIKWLAMTSGQTLTYTVGTASGTASTVSSGTLTITTISAGSGSNGTGTAYAATATAGAAGGTATGGDINIAGGIGGASYGSSTTVLTNFSGKGGDCPGFGTGGTAVGCVATAGVQGNGYGAGGGGAHGSNTAANGRGGIIIFETF